MADEEVNKDVVKSQESGEVSRIDSLRPQSPEQVEELVARLQTELLKDVDLTTLPEAHDIGDWGEVDQAPQKILTGKINTYLEAHPLPSKVATKLLDTYKEDTAEDPRWKNRGNPVPRWNNELKTALAGYALTKAGSFGDLDAIKDGMSGLIFGHESYGGRPQPSKSGAFEQPKQEVLRDNPLYRLYDSLPKSQVFRGAVRT